MKKAFAVLLACSLTLNAALLYLLVSGGHSQDGAATPVVVQKTAATKTEASRIDAEVWPNLNTDDLSQLVARLRGAGFPSAIVRAIVAAQLQQLFAARRKALDPDADRRPFWKNQPTDPKLQLALRQLEREQGKALRDLLGDAAQSDDPMSRLYQDRRFAGVPPDKLPQIRQVLQNFDDLRQDIYVNMRGGFLPDEGARLAALEKQQHAELAKLLSPAELDHFDLLSGNTANGLRANLSAFNPTEQEFIALYQLQRTFDDSISQQYGQPLSQEDIVKRNLAQQLLKDQIKAALGLDRYADYERTTDYSFRQTSQLVARLELPPETANQMWSLQQDIQQRANAVRGDGGLPNDQRTAQLAALKAEATSKVTTLLGARGFEAYKQNGGYWFQQLVPPQAKGN